MQNLYDDDNWLPDSQGPDPVAQANKEIDLLTERFNNFIAHGQFNNITGSHLTATDIEAGSATIDTFNSRLSNIDHILFDNLTTSKTLIRHLNIESAARQTFAVFPVGTSIYFNLKGVSANPLMNWQIEGFASEQSIAGIIDQRLISENKLPIMNIGTGKIGNNIYLWIGKDDTLDCDVFGGFINAEPSINAVADQDVSSIIELLSGPNGQITDGFICSDFSFTLDPLVYQLTRYKDLTLSIPYIRPFPTDQPHYPSSEAVVNLVTDQTFYLEQEINQVQQNLNNQVSLINIRIDGIESTLTNQINEVYSELNTRITQEVSVINNTIESEVNRIDNKITDLDISLTNLINTKIDDVNIRITNVTNELTQYIDQGDSALRDKIDGVETKLEDKIEQCEDNCDRKIQDLTDTMNATDRELQDRIDETTINLQIRIEQGDEATLQSAIDYANSLSMGGQTWLPAVQTRADLPTSVPSPGLNYLCRVINDPDPLLRGVYQWISGSTGWTYFSDNSDFIDQIEVNDNLDLIKVDSVASTNTTNVNGMFARNFVVSEYKDTTINPLTDNGKLIINSNGTWTKVINNVAHQMIPADFHQAQADDNLDLIKVDGRAPVKTSQPSGMFERNFDITEVKSTYSLTTDNGKLIIDPTLSKWTKILNNTAYSIDISALADQSIIDANLDLIKINGMLPVKTIQPDGKYARLFTLYEVKSVINTTSDEGKLIINPATNQWSIVLNGTIYNDISIDKEFVRNSLSPIYIDGISSVNTSSADPDILIRNFNVTEVKTTPVNVTTDNGKLIINTNTGAWTKVLNGVAYTISPGQMGDITQTDVNDNLDLITVDGVHSTNTLTTNNRYNRNYAVTEIKASVDTTTDNGKLVISPSSPTWTKVVNGTAYSISGGVTSVNGQTGVVNLTKADIGLGNVDNTSDMSKPVSTLQQSAITTAKQEAIDTAAAALANHANNSNIHVTASEKATWNEKASVAYVDSEVDSARADQADALSNHSNNTNIHVTSTEKAIWNAKASETYVNESIIAHNADPQAHRLMTFEWRGSSIPINAITVQFYTSAAASQVSSGTITPCITDPSYTLQYSLNNGASWNTWTSGPVSSNGTNPILFKGSGSGLFTSESENNRWQSASGYLTITGSMASMAYEPLANYAFASMFQGLTGLIEAPELPFETMSISCYQNMFRSCANLIDAPALPATTLANQCYYGMFSGSGIIHPPALPAMTLANSCYYGMFSGCTSLIDQPALPAMTLANSCYYGMFSGCTSLVNAPALPAMTLANSCYSSMFNTTAFLTPPQLPATTLASSCYDNMFANSSITTPPQLNQTGLQQYCYQYMFANSPNLLHGPSLSQTTLQPGCYQGMFSGCTSLTYIQGNELPATMLRTYCYDSMFINTGLQSIVIRQTSYQSPVTGQMTSMFYNCSNLNSIRVYFSSWSYDTTSWVYGVAQTGTFYCPLALPNTRDSSHIPVNWSKVQNT